MAVQPSLSTSFLQRLSRGPWPKPVITRLRQALSALADKVAETSGAVGLILFGSYARGEYGRKSDVDLLLLLSDPKQRRPFLGLAGELESTYQLPMHLALLIADPSCPDELGTDLLHAIWTDGVVLHADAAALALLQPRDLVPWEVIRFTGKQLSAAKRVDLSRRLYGRGEREGLVVPPGLSLGPGVVLLPPTQALKVKDALDEIGASYDVFPIWRGA